MRLANLKKFGMLTSANPMANISPTLAKIGLLIVRGLVQMKRLAIKVASIFLVVAKPIGGLVLSLFLLPLYEIAFSFRHQLSSLYRPAKNRFMFFLSNRFAVHVVAIMIAVVAGASNIQVGTVRAEKDAVGQKSILYALVSTENVEIIEEYVDPKAAKTNVPTSYLGSAVLTTEPVASDIPSFVDTTLTATVAVDAPAVPRTRTEVETYTIASGDTLSSIAEQFGISLDTLLWANNLTVRSIIKPGNTLSILPVTGVEHTVRSGDTISAISKTYDVSSDEILAYNNIASADALKVGQRLIVPGGEKRVSAPVARPVTVAVKEIFTSAPSDSSADTTLAEGASMIWPTDLKYIVRKTSWFHTGYDIDCNGHADGTSTNDNYAAADGIIQFSGTKKGYGLTVEVNHGDGLVTRYGHFNSLYVKSGDSVTAGTPLGRCGSTGNSTGTHLHFEVLLNGVFKNPGDYLAR